MSTSLEDLLRWEAAGGTWRLNEQTVILMTCSGEEMGRLTSRAADFLDYVQQHGS